MSALSPAEGANSDTERALISKACSEGTIEQVIAHGIEADHFADPACAAVYEAAVDHVRRYRSVPTLKAIKATDAGKKFAFEIAGNALDYYIEHFKAEVNRRVADKAIVKAAEIVGQGNHDEMLNLGDTLLGIAHEVARQMPTPATSRFSNMQQRIDEYRRREKEGTPLGILTGFQPIDDLTLGTQRHEYVSIVGWQGTGKSTLGIKKVYEAWKQEKSSLVFSLEMGADALLRKLDNMAMNEARAAADLIRYHDVKALTLSDDELKYWERIAGQVDSLEHDIIIMDDVGRCTVERVEAELIRREPDLCMIDYVTLMDVPNSRSNSMWEAVTYITRNLKGIARGLGIPIIGIAQTNIDSADDGAQLKNIAYSRSIGQDSDLVFGLFQNEEMRLNKKMTVRMLKNRDGKIIEVDLYWDPEHGVYRMWVDGVDTWLPKTAFMQQVQAAANPPTPTVATP